eukprot:TRINITY_DN4437_c0_g1_i14.p1 TRINITY_DN4437_c0_g1~~TRINITY_DN4437_c0_g1_i14.p1  ORF type:complete len:138 (+),score=17.15 TRINITY_DN4437_c0_g1_i14:254-667(+)
MKPENLFGKTYGTLTYLSSAGMYNKGADVPSDLRYRSTQSEAFIDQLGLRSSQMEIAKDMSNGGENLKFGEILKTQTVSILELTTKGGHSPRSTARTEGERLLHTQRLSPPPRVRDPLHLTYQDAKTAAKSKQECAF